MVGDIGQSLVAHDPAARDILVLRFALAPGGERLQPAEYLRLAARTADTPPCLAGIVGVIVRIGQLLHLRIQPRTAPGIDQLLEHLGKDFRQMRDVSDGIFYLPVGQRAAAPNR